MESRVFGKHSNSTPCIVGRFRLTSPLEPRPRATNTANSRSKLSSNSTSAGKRSTSNNLLRTVSRFMERKEKQIETEKEGGSRSLFAKNISDKLNKLEAKHRDHQQFTNEESPLIDHQVTVKYSLESDEIRRLELAKKELLQRLNRTEDELHQTRHLLMKKEERVDLLANEVLQLRYTIASKESKQAKREIRILKESNQKLQIRVRQLEQGHEYNRSPREDVCLPLRGSEPEEDDSPHFHQIKHFQSQEETLRNSLIETRILGLENENAKLKAELQEKKTIEEGVVFQLSQMAGNSNNFSFAQLPSLLEEQKSKDELLKNLRKVIQSLQNEVSELRKNKETKQLMPNHDLEVQEAMLTSKLTPNRETINTVSPNIHLEDSFPGFLCIGDKGLKESEIEETFEKISPAFQGTSEVHYQLDPPTQITESIEPVHDQALTFSNLPGFTPTRIKTIVPKSRSVEQEAIDLIRLEIIQLKEENRKIRAIQEEHLKRQSKYEEEIQQKVGSSSRSNFTLGDRDNIHPKILIDNASSIEDVKQTLEEYSAKIESFWKKEGPKSAEDLKDILDRSNKFQQLALASFGTNMETSKVDNAFNLTEISPLLSSNYMTSEYLSDVIGKVDNPQSQTLNKETLCVPHQLKDRTLDKSHNEVSFDSFVPIKSPNLKKVES